MILRKHGNLILSLCAMMISTGLPELTSERDLNYLRETLVGYYLKKMFSRIALCWFACRCFQNQKKMLSIISDLNLMRLLVTRGKLP